ncbi:MAG TPA: isoprenylcysteine carboxylmethyltransferase family protein, partial [Longimicrobiaceae bacterium]|nr:isoprenylcysteine carboxylmethyltransferase family protein [Longimicrobiaceae bacterium]
LPFTVTVIVPSILIGRDGADAPAAGRLGGALLMLLGMALVAATVWHFATRGRGTLAPWDPPRHLVVSGIYRYVRNPMISGVVLVLAGESLLFASTAVAAWTAVFFAVNAIYIPLLEEPGLSRRFGAAYDEYRRHVPRWIPRLSPWPPAADASAA